MSALIKPQPRPFLSIVKDLALNQVTLASSGKSSKTQRTSSTRTAVMHVAINDSMILESGRNNALLSMAGAMRRKGMTETAIAAALHAENQARCVPPLDPQEVEGIARSIGRYEQSNADEVQRSLSDTGNANRFGQALAGRVIFVAGQGWMIWDGQKWVRDEQEFIMELAKQLVRGIYQEGEGLQDNDLRNAIHKHAKSSQQLPRLKAMTTLAQSMPEVVTPSSALDAHEMLIGVANGVVDLRSGKLKPNEPELRISRHSPVVFDADAECPLFMSFLDQITAGQKPLIRYLQRVVGYSLTGKTGEQCLFFLFGMGANGKSTFLNVMRELLGGDLSRQIASETLMVRRTNATNDIARLAGVRVVIANEVEDGSPLSESLVKAITGGDIMTARFLYHEHFEFIPKFKLFIAGNHKPTIRGRDNGIWRRIRLIPFTVTIPPEQRDKDLLTKLRSELPGILNWAIKGCQAWQKGGLNEPPLVTEAVKDYRDEMDLIKQWIDARCAVGTALEVKSRAAYMDYSEWAKAGGYHPLSESVFSRELEQEFRKVKRNDGNYFIGIRVKSWQDFNPGVAPVVR